MCVRKLFFDVIPQCTFLAFLVLLCVFSRSFADVLNSPCPNTFQYGYDEFGSLSGTIVVESPNDNLIQLNVELYVGNPVQGYNGHLELVESKTQVIEDVLMRKPIRYKLFFPTWRGMPPRVMKILLNGNVICYGSQISSTGIATTINLQHKLRIDLNPTDPPADPFRPPNAAALSPQTTPNRHEPTLKRNTNDNSRPPPAINFNPRPPKDPKRIYSGNPFLTGLATTNPFFRDDDDDQEEFAVMKKNNNAPEVVVVMDKRPVGGNNDVKTIDFEERTPETAAPTTTRDDRRKPDVANAPYADVCGRSVNSNSLVVLGEPVPRGAFPWLVAIFVLKNLGPEFRCSGSLISRRHVLTAAHCLRTSSKNIRPDELLLILGKLNIRNWYREQGLQVGAEHVEVHAGYQPLSADADLAIITLAQDVEFTRFVRPVCLSTGGDLREIVNETGTVVGWGKNEYGDFMTEVPKKVDMPVVSQEECTRSKYSFRDITSERTFCAGRRDGSGPCNGDSGGGFLMMRDGRWVLRGIVSTSLYDQELKTCDLSSYVVFTDASKFADWILSRIK